MRFRDFILKEMGGMTSTATLGAGNPFGFSDLANPSHMDTGGRFSAIVGRGNMVLQPILYSLRRFAHFCMSVYAWQQNMNTGQANNQYDPQTNKFFADIDQITDLSVITNIPEEALKLPGGGAITPDEIHLAQTGYKLRHPLTGAPVNLPPFLTQQGASASGGVVYTLSTKALKEQIDQIEQIQYQSGNIGGMVDRGAEKFWNRASEPGAMKYQTGVNPNQ